MATHQAKRSAVRVSKPRTLRPVRPSAAIDQLYQRQLTDLIDEMHDSILYWVKAAWRRSINYQPLPIAQDDSGGLMTNLLETFRKMRAQWQKSFDHASVALARRFVRSVEQRVSGAVSRDLRQALRDDSRRVSVKFSMTKAMQQVVGASVQANVALIKSIPEQYLERVEGIILRSVQTGRDIGFAAKAIEHQFGVTKRRAALIARDQNNKATAALARARYLEMGLTEAVWLHSHGGREPRPTHVRAGREKTRYSVSEGWYDPAVKKHIHPGELINCRCVGKPVVPGFS